MKIFLFRRRWLAVLPVVLVALSMLYVVNYPPMVDVSATTRQLPIYSVQRDQKVLSLSFDAAWGDVRVR